MGFLRGVDIDKKIGFQPESHSEETFSIFQNMVFDLITKAYAIIKTNEPLTKTPDEPDISAQLIHAMDLLVQKNAFPLSISPESHEYTDDIIAGIKSTLTAKRFDIHFSNWNVRQPFKFGVEAKLLTEVNFDNKVASALVREYVSDAGMGKFINGISKSRGCMVGYIIQGNIAAIITNINNKIVKTYR